MRKLEMQQGQAGVERITKNPTKQMESTIQTTVGCRAWLCGTRLKPDPGRPSDIGTLPG